MNKVKRLALIFSLGMMVFFMIVFVGCEDQVTVTDNGANLQGTGAAKPIKVIGNPTNANGGSTVISSNMTFDRDTCYQISGFVHFTGTAVLNIQSGTHIFGLPDNTSTTIVDPGTIIINKGAKINAVGTPNCPIVMTAQNGQRGGWGGLVICGRATVNIGTGTIEGITPPPGNPTLGEYGQVPGVDNDDSGTLSYVRIEYAGHSISEPLGNETNGVTLGGVGNQTDIDHVMVTEGFDDGFEWFGGTVNAKYLISYRNRDDDFDTDQGYSGTVQFGISIRCEDDEISVEPVNGHESNGDDDDAISDFTDAVFSNFTIIGPVFYNETVATSGISANYNSGILMRDATELQVYNSLVMGYPNYQLEVLPPTAFPSPVTMHGNVAIAPIGATGITNVNGTDFVNENNQGFQAASTTCGDAESMCGLSSLSSGAWLCPGCGQRPNLVPTGLTPLIENAETGDPAYDYTGISTNPAIVQVNFVGAFGLANDVNNANWNYNSNWVTFSPTCEVKCPDQSCTN